MRKLPDLEAWAIFAKVAETGSFARAAADLSLSQATVSKAIARLEERTQVTLFHRTSRRISLTESGHASLERASRILQEGEAVEAEVSDQSDKLHGLIRVSAPMSFGLSRLAPILPDFMQAHPDIKLEVQFDDRQVDLVADRFDLALRIANLDDSSLLARRLCRVRVLLVGSPKYFERYGRPQHPSELATHKVLQYAYSRSSGKTWRFRHKEQGEFNLALSANLHVNNADALTPTLLAGLGVALQPEFLACEHLQSGELETAMNDWEAEAIGLHIVTPPGRRRPLRVQALIDYLAQSFSHEPWASTESTSSKI